MGLRIPLKVPMFSVQSHTPIVVFLRLHLACLLNDRLVSHCHFSFNPLEEIWVPENAQARELVYHRDEM